MREQSNVIAKQEIPRKDYKPMFPHRLGSPRSDGSNKPKISGQHSTRKSFAVSYVCQAGGDRVGKSKAVRPRCLELSRFVRTCLTPTPANNRTEHQSIVQSPHQPKRVSRKRHVHAPDCKTRSSSPRKKTPSRRRTPFGKQSETLPQQIPAA